ncbi:sensor histidine kinase [Streptomyces sp. NPDC053427]|uniref:sensor histidine kinase n=1 Tax=Streptomyces sp. NPDC053427 TaxID=3365701 RepID=UPI0037D16A33
MSRTKATSSEATPSPTPPTGPTAPAPAGRAGVRRLAVVAEACGAVLYLAGAASGSFGFFDALPSAEQAAVGCAAVALLLLRRKVPIMALLGLAVVAGILPTAGLLTAVVAYTAARRVDNPRHRAGVLLAAAALPVVTGVFGTLATDYGSWLAGFALGALVAGVGVLIPGLVGSSKGQQERLVLALRDRAASAEQARRLADSASRAEERARITAEMHDLVGHRLSLISLHSGGLEMALAATAPELKEEAAQVRLATRDAMRELREVLGVLGPLGRDTGTDALTDATGTRSDIAALAEESRAAGIPVAFTWDGPDLDTLEPRLRRAVHRVVRESLTNIHRYAPSATTELSVAHTTDRIRLVIRNGAPRTAPEATTGLGTGSGLTGLRERLRLLGGELRAEPTAVGGFLVEASLPLHPAAAAPAAPPAETPPHRDPVHTDALPGVLRHLPGVAAGVLGLAGVGAMLLLGLSLVQSARPVVGSVPDRTVHLGMTREDVRATVGFESDLAGAAAAGREPPRPPGTACLFPYETDRGTHGRLALTRYCFRNDVLVDIKKFTVPIAPEGPTATPAPTSPTSPPTSPTAPGSPR